MMTMQDEGQMTKHAELAAVLDCREYREETTREIIDFALTHGLVIAYGASDDTLELAGALDDEIGAYGGVSVEIGRDDKGLFIIEKPGDKFPRGYKAPRAIATITATWAPDGSRGPSWVVSTDAPHSTFRTVEDGELYCIGVVVEIPS